MAKMLKTAIIIARVVWDPDLSLEPSEWDWDMLLQAPHEYFDLQHIELGPDEALPVEFEESEDESGIQGD